MVNVVSASFDKSISLLSSAVFPDSTKTQIWLDNSKPSAGSYSKCVALDVLDSFGIPYDASTAPTTNDACKLPGYDINNMDAIQVIKLSLAAYLKDGELWDVHINGSGVAEFVRVFPSNKTVSLDIRMCLSQSLYDDTVRVVVVRGYDAPPVRQIKEGEEVIPSSKLAGDLSPLQVANSKCAIISEANLYGSISNEVGCSGRAYHRTAIVSYKDPVLQAAYKDGAESLYEPLAFESVAGYIIDIDTGHTDLNVTYQQSNTTSVTYTLPFTGLNSTASHCAVVDGGGATYAQFASSSYVLDDVVIDDRFGEPWPIFMGVSGLKVIGHTIQQATDARAAPGGGISLFIDDRIVHLAPPVNKNWHWELVNGVPILYVYSPRYGSSSLQDYIFDILTTTADKLIRPYRAANTWAVNKDDYALDSGVISGLGASWPNLGNGIGTLVYKLVVTVDIDRPSIVVNDPKGSALLHANNLKITYYPIVMKDAPVPIGYNIGGSSNTVDHTLDIYDNDPTTVQQNPVTVPRSLTWLEAQKTGSTIDISLPFLETAEECRDLANTIYDLYNNFGNSSITTYNLVCGPNDEPVLGANVEGFNDALRINQISYNYQDGSSYNISVSLGPVFESLGSWNTSAWQRKTETVQRQGIIVWSAGDGCSYRVRVQGLGEYFALNTTATTTFFPGEKVSVTIHNNPVEV